MSIYGDGASEGIGSSLTAPGGAGPKGGGVCATVTNGLRSAAAGWCRLVKPVSEKVGVSESAGGSLLALLICTLCAVGLYFSGAGEAAEEMMAANSAAVVRSALSCLSVCQTGSCRLPRGGCD